MSTTFKQTWREESAYRRRRGGYTKTKSEVWVVCPALEAATLPDDKVVTCQEDERDLSVRLVQLAFASRFPPSNPKLTRCLVKREHNYSTRTQELAVHIQPFEFFHSGKKDDDPALALAQELGEVVVYTGGNCVQKDTDIDQLTQCYTRPLAGHPGFRTYKHSPQMVKRMQTLEHKDRVSIDEVDRLARRIRGVADDLAVFAINRDCWVYHGPNTRETAEKRLRDSLCAIEQLGGNYCYRHLQEFIKFRARWKATRETSERFWKDTDLPKWMAAELAKRPAKEKYPAAKIDPVGLYVREPKGKKASSEALAEAL